MGPMSLEKFSSSFFSFFKKESWVDSATDKPTFAANP
jgi:hypothetical protein